MVAVEGRSMLPEPDWIQQASTLEGMTHALEEALEGMDLRPAPDAPPLAPDAVYTLGEWQQRAPLRQIVRGFVEPVRRVPLVSRVPEPVVLYLVHKLPGGAESLKREHHKGVGWHYHYLDKRKGRSNVVLCWDTRWEAAKTEEERKAQGPRPIFWEHHGEGNADFSARSGAIPSASPCARSAPAISSATSASFVRPPMTRSPYGPCCRSSRPEP